MKTQNVELRRYKLGQMRKLIKEVCMPELGSFKDQSYKKLAEALSEPFVEAEFDLEIYKQLLWTWADKRALPSPTIIKVLAKLSEEGTLPSRFAERTLEILALEETPAQKNITELGYDRASG